MVLSEALEMHAAGVNLTARIHHIVPFLVGKAADGVDVAPPPATATEDTAHKTNHEEAQNGEEKQTHQHTDNQFEDELDDKVTYYQRGHHCGDTPRGRESSVRRLAAV